MDSGKQNEILQMHEYVLENFPEYISVFKQLAKLSYREKHYVSMAAIHNHNAPHGNTCVKVVLQDLFPVLTNALIHGIDPGMVDNGTTQKGTDIKIANGQTTGTGFQMRLVKHRETMLSFAIFPLKSDGYAYELIQKTENDAIKHHLHVQTQQKIIVCVGLTWTREECRNCGEKNIHMFRCGRCWKQLGVPVWYCSQECQVTNLL